MQAMSESPSRLQQWLSFPRVLWLALGAALALTLPGLRSGYFGDAYVSLGALAGRPSPVPVYTTPLALFRYAWAIPPPCRPTSPRASSPGGRCRS